MFNFFKKPKQETVEVYPSRWMALKEPKTSIGFHIELSWINQMYIKIKSKPIDYDSRFECNSIRIYSRTSSVSEPANFDSVTFEPNDKIYSRVLDGYTVVQDENLIKKLDCFESKYFEDQEQERIDREKRSIELREKVGDYILGLKC